MYQVTTLSGKTGWLMTAGIAACCTGAVRGDVLVLMRDRAVVAADVRIDASGVQLSGGQAAPAGEVVGRDEVSVMLFDVLPRDAAARAWVCLRDGRRLSGESVEVEDDRVALQTSPGGDVVAGMAEVRALYFHARRPDAAGSPAEGVRIVSTNGDTLNVPTLDWVDGGALVEVDPSLDPIPLPRERIAAILWPEDSAGASATTPVVAQPLVDLRTGERLAGDVASLDSERIVVRSGGQDLSIPRREVEAIRFASPVEAAAETLVSPAPETGERPLWRINRNALGGPLRMGSRMYRRGFGLRAGGTVEIPVPKGARWLIATAGADADGARTARMRLAIHVDGDERFGSDEITPGAAAGRIAVRVQDAAVIKLSVSPAGDDPAGCLGDFAHVVFVH